MKQSIVAVLLCASLGLAETAAAQGISLAATKPRPWSRISFFTNSSVMTAEDGTTTPFNELTTALSYQLPEMDENGAEYGLDVRYSAFAEGARPNRTSVYEGFVGGRLGTGAVRFRAGHLWLNDLGSLGSLAGGVFEFRQRRAAVTDPRWRVGVFGGLEPNILDVGYAADVKKYGAYVAYDGTEARRHSVGYALIRQGALTERSVVTTTNFLPINRKVFIYQAAEYDVQAPAGMARNGLAYFFANGRVTPTPRFELQGTYNRGRSIDARGLGDDILNGRPITQTSVDGLLFQSIGGRATVEVLPRVRVYVGYSRDKNNRDTDSTGRTQVGGYASSIAGSGLDVSASESLMNRPTGSFRSRYISIGRQFGRSIYISGDYSTSLSVILFSRGDGIIIETRPHTTRYSGTATINVSRTLSLLASIEQTTMDVGHEYRLLTGLTYRIR